MAHGIGGATGFTIEELKNKGNAGKIAIAITAGVLGLSAVGTAVGVGVHHIVENRDKNVQAGGEVVDVSVLENIGPYNDIIASLKAEADALAAQQKALEAQKEAEAANKKAEAAAKEQQKVQEKRTKEFTEDLEDFAKSQIKIYENINDNITKKAAVGVMQSEVLDNLEAGNVDAAAAFVIVVCEEGQKRPFSAQQQMYFAMGKVLKGYYGDNYKEMMTKAYKIYDINTRDTQNTQNTPAPEAGE